MNLNVITVTVCPYRRCAMVSTTVATTVMRPTVTAENDGVCFHTLKQLVFLALRVVDFKHTRALYGLCIVTLK